MNKYGDEDYIYLLKIEEEWEHPKEKHVNRITDGYLILREETVPFHRAVISDFGYTMLVPEAFDVMPEPLLAVKYPDAGGRLSVLSSPGTTMNIAFRKEEDQWRPEETEAARDAVRQSALTAQNWKEADGCKTTLAGEIRIASFDFISAASDSELYNRMFLFSLHDGMIFGNFSCLQENQYEWKEIVLQMLQSVQALQIEPEKRKGAAK